MPFKCVFCLWSQIYSTLCRVTMTEVFIIHITEQWVSGTGGRSRPLTTQPFVWTHTSFTFAAGNDDSPHSLLCLETLMVCLRVSFCSLMYTVRNVTHCWEECVQPCSCVCLCVSVSPHTKRTDVWKELAVFQQQCMNMFWANWFCTC